jgi:hypothetical protein
MWGMQGRRRSAEQQVDVTECASMTHALCCSWLAKSPVKNGRGMGV